MTPGNTGKWMSASDDASDRAPLFRHEFESDDSIQSATLMICGLGYYEARINGRRVGDHVLDPAQTDYERRVFYVTHDVTRLVRSGTNCIGVMLGNGWYNQDRVWQKNGYVYGKPTCLLELHLSFGDCSDTVIATDASWTWAPGPVTDNNIYAGESYDARLELPGWASPGFDGSAWAPVDIVPGPGGRLEPQQMPPMRRIEERRPLGISEISPGVHIVDVGQNLSGWSRITVEADAGTEIVMRFAEMVTADGNVDTSTTGVFATGVEQVDRYTCKGGGPEQWEPRFTYHGFRYIEVTGWPGELTAEDISAIVVHTDLPIAGSFECSDERLNQLHQMALWTHRSNIHGIPEDCPARERCGWLGDANLVAEYSMWNYSSKAFWEKFLDDIETSRAANNGIPTNIAPGKRGKNGDAQPDWAAAFIMLPWYVYLYYGDPAVLEAHWDGMEALMAHFADKAENWSLSGGYGDFFDPGTDSIVMHTPQVLTTTLWFYRCSVVMAAMATALNKQGAAQTYGGWSQEIAAALTAECFDSTSGSFGSQAANTLALAFEILPDEGDRIFSALVDDILERDTHLNVGVMGVRFIFEQLTQRGRGDLALALMHQDSYPSFGHLIKRGATTLWECWGEAGHDGTHGPRSLSHPFMGGFDNWFYNTLAGIRPDPANPGFRHFFLEPHAIPGLDEVSAHHDSPHGRIASRWQQVGGTFEWDVAVPDGTKATATLPWSYKTLTLQAGTHKLTDQ